MIFLPNQMIATAKWAFSTRRVDRSLAIGLDPDVGAAKPGELTRLGLRPMALTGILSCSPMASAEALAATGIEIVSRGQLHDPVEANRFAALVGASPRAATAA